MSRQAESVARQVAARVLKLKREEETPAEFARRLGISPQLLNHYQNGGGTSVEALAAMSERGHDVASLMTGKTRRGDVVAVGREEVENLRTLLEQALGAVERFAPTGPAEGASRPLSDSEVASEGQLPDERAE